MFHVTGWAPPTRSIAAAAEELLTDPRARAEARDLYTRLQVELGLDADAVDAAIATDHGWAEPVRTAALAHASSGGRTYHFELAWASAVPNVGAAHLVDLPFFFGNLDQPGVPALLGDEVRTDPATIALGDAVSASLAQFVRRRRPRRRSAREWPRLQPTDDRATMILGRESHVERHHLADRLDFLGGSPRRRREPARPDAGDGRMTGVVAQPSYRREDLTVGIVHFGVGNFHRSHQAMYLERLFDAGLARDWAICGVGVLPGATSGCGTRSAAQSMRYTLVERYPDGAASARTIGSIAQYLFAPEDPLAVVERLADPAVRIVSLTITEGGYNADDVTGEFDLAQPGVAADLEPGAPPRTVFGLVAEGARMRRDRGIAPFTIMSCDNLPDNGRVAERSFIAFARAKDPELGDWMAREIAFPSSMVDRITPVTGPEELAFVREAFGIDDVCARRLGRIRAVGARGPLLDGPTAPRGRRGAARRRRDAVRADEAQAAQRRPPGTRLPRLPLRPPVRA